MAQEDFKKRKYKSNYITNVILNCRLPKVLDLMESKPPSDFQKKIENVFPLINQLSGDIYQLSPNLFKQEKRVGWEFTNKEQNKKIFLEPETLEIEFTEYSTFEDFFDTVKIVFNALVESYSTKIIKRSSLRYINQIYFKYGNSLDWGKYITKSLFRFPKEFFNEKIKPLRYLYSLEFKENGYNVRFNYGLFNTEYPSPINRKEFVLDYDCYLKEDIETSEALEKVKEFHETADRWFEMSILQPLRKKMGVMENEK